jgi:predicted DCC family thiol-disulfide oxidoreductase YuxK
LFNFILKLYDKKVDSTGLSIFRIFYCLTLFCEVAQLFFFKDLIFSRIPFLDPYELDFTIPIILWMIILLFMTLGLFTKISSIINYVLSLVFISTISQFEYHMFYLYMGVNFIIMFLNLSSRFSLDNLIYTLKYSNTKNEYSPSYKVSVLSYFIIIFFALGFVYADSVLYKVTSHNWTSGIGLWLPASQPFMTHLNLQWLLNQKYLMLFLGYLTVIFETVFIFTFFIKRLRIILLIIGIGLHVGILILFPIPWFALGVISIYFLMVPFSWWNFFKFNLKKITFYYDEECPLCLRTKIILSFFDVFGCVKFKGVQTYGKFENKFKNINKEELIKNIYSVKKNGQILVGINTYKYILLLIPVTLPIGIILHIPPISNLSKFIYKKVAEKRYVERCTDENCNINFNNNFNSFKGENSFDDFKISKYFSVKKLKVIGIIFGVFILCLLQLNASLESGVMKQVSDKIKKNYPSFTRRFENVSFPIMTLSQRFFGITRHPVFMDDHFNNYNHIIAIQEVDDSNNKKFLPLINENGQPFGYNYSFIFVNYTFRVNSPNINYSALKKGLKNYSIFWLKKTKKNISDSKFKLLVKKIKVPRKWEKDWLNKQISNPWLDGGSFYWDNENFFNCSIKQIELL